MDRFVLGRPLRFSVAALAGTLAEVMAFWLIFLRPPGFAGQTILLAAILHALAPLGFCANVLSLRGIEKSKMRSLRADRYFNSLAALLVFFLPGAGITGVLFLAVGCRFHFRREGLAVSYQKGFELHDEGKIVPEDEDLDLFLNEELRIEPMVDILQGDDVGLKRGSINVLRRMKTPGSVALLKKALSDRNPEIRFYAHTALSRLEEEYTEAVAEAKELLENNEDSVSARKLLGRAYRRYAMSGLAEGNMREQYLAFARNAYEEALAHDPSPGITLNLGTICLELGDVAGAEKNFRAAMQHKSTRVDACLGICRAYYDQGDLKKLSEFVREMRAVPELYALEPYKAELFSFWAQPEAEG